MLSKYVERVVQEVLDEGAAQGRGETWRNRTTTHHVLKAVDHLTQFLKLKHGVPTDAGIDKDELIHLGHAAVRILFAIEVFREEQ